MKPKIISNYVPLLSSVADDFITYLEPKTEIEDCLLEMKKFTTESVGLLSLTTKMNSFTDKPKYEMVSHLTEAFDLFHKALYSQFKLFKYFRTPLYKRFEIEYRIINRIVDKMVEDRLKEIKEPNQRDLEANEQNDFLLALLSDSRITQQQAHIIIRELFAGGIESTSNALTFSLFELAKNMDKQDKLREEIMKACKEGLTKDALSNMHYLKSCVKETFRKKIWFITFYSTKKCDSSNVRCIYHTPLFQTLIMAIPHSMLENEEFFPNHDQFIPERWLRSIDEEGIAYKRIYPFSHTPFGHGVRSCIGQRFGENQMYVALAKTYIFVPNNIVYFAMLDSVVCFDNSWRPPTDL
ncbi:hypothetical protein KUTeg_018996 [Tegillarca granosa]|uniref:Cytochrome P450 n=1 Tax=Tegillarca granosa TaxID=220873 RepID=A0ABQ9EBP6_TEGGR|nr:hypothetical protein KUTeg_018996 [Tegillarca granosa]